MVAVQPVVSGCHLTSCIIISLSLSLSLYLSLFTTSDLSSDTSHVLYDYYYTYISTIAGDHKKWKKGKKGAGKTKKWWDLSVWEL